MDDIALDDEKKPFDAETAQEEESQPDPDESLMMESGNGRVWVVKVSPSRHIVSFSVYNFHRFPVISWNGGQLSTRMV